MTLARFAFVVCLAGLLISVMVVVVLLAVYGAGLPLIDVFIRLNVVLKLGAILLIAAALLSLVLATMHRAKRRRDARLALWLRVLAGLSVAVGLLFALYRWAEMQIVAREFAVSVAITSLTWWVDIALMLALGFLPAVIALLGAAPVRVERR